MSTQPAVTMKELELEHAELLPSRETLCVSKCHPSCGSSSSRCPGCCTWSLARLTAPGARMPSRMRPVPTSAGR